MSDSQMADAFMSIFGMKRKKDVDCFCMECDIDENIIRTRMSVCPDCGNKRCPKATNHENPCSGSNEHGQKGSAYQ